MTLRFRIRDILIATALVALFVGFYAPELRSMDHNARVVLISSAIITAVSLVSFTPVWVVLLWFRRRFRHGQPIGIVHYAAVFAAFLSGLGIIVAIGLTIRWLVVR